MSRTRRFLRTLVGLLTLRFLRRRGERERLERRVEQQQRAADEELRRRSLEEDAQVEPERPLGEQVEELEERHEEVGERSPRRAEPPLAVELETEPDPRSELLAAAALLLAGAGAAGFIVFYVVFPDTQLLGLTIGSALVLIGVACALAGKRILPREKVAEEYHYFGDEGTQRDVEDATREAGESVTRRRLLLGAAGVAGGGVGAAALFPVASLGPNVGDIVYATAWRRGRRVVDRDDTPILAVDVQEGTFLTGFPEGASKEDLGSPLILVRVPLPDLELPPERRAGAPDGILAFSKICPHAACAVSIYRHPLYDETAPQPALVCPCHYSTFDPNRGGALLFGPAGRDLPQLPLRITPLGELEADGDFYDAIGPSYGGTRLRPGGSSE